MILIDGLGQLGSELKKYQDLYSDIYIYHTWNIDDKSLGTQKKEYEKFCKFVDGNKDKNIVFISTLHENYCDYFKYKLKAELYLFENTEKGKIIRLPYMVGKGMCKKIKHDNYKPFAGIIEIDTVENVAKRIISVIGNDKRVQFLHGQYVESSTVYELIRID